MLDILHFHPIRDLKRQALLAEPFPPEWDEYIQANLAYYALLTPDEQARLRDDARIFASEKDWEAGGGHELTDEIKITISAEACLLLLGWDDSRRADMFPNVATVLVYPTGYRATDKSRTGLVENVGEQGRLGEAWSSDLPVVLSWQSARENGRVADNGHNVVLHEFAHKLDMVDGRAADGVPVLQGGDDAYDKWAEVMETEYEALVHDAEKGHKSFLDHYGATNPAEFFAVGTEAFFEKPTRMRDDHPNLYAAFASFYEQDTAARFERWHELHGEAPVSNDTA